MSDRDRRLSPLLAALAFLLVLLIWQVPELNGLLYPFRYFVTTIHEMSHGLAAVISGGTFVEYQVYASGAGVATTAHRAPWLVIPAGYVGTALFGAVLLYLTNRNLWTHVIAMALGFTLGAITLVFARNSTAILVGLLSAAALIALGWKAPRLLVTFVLNILAMLTGLNAVLDVWGLLHNLNASAVTGLGNIPNDAYHMAQAVGILPAAGWAVIWMIQALALLGFSAYLTFWRPLHRRADDPTF
ncbi:MAG: M50 family metallopeptidase [Anaerolineae bacterium]|nr:M50 family metallopeptidase [Anaerolineae bacterium]